MLPLPEVGRTGVVHVLGNGYQLVPIEADQRQFRDFLYAKEVARFVDTAGDLVGEPLTPWRCSVPDSNDDLLTQLSGQAGAASLGSTDDLLAQLNREPDPDPMADVECTGDLEEDSKAELTALQKGFRARAKREQERLELATDSEYWVAVCWKSRADKELFLRRAGLLGIGDKYMDGYAVARVLGLSMDPDNQ